MGIVNRTPDSFYDGGRYVEHAAARELVEQLVREGADIVDIGAESSRPAAPPVDAATQIERLGDTLALAASLGVDASVDTTSPEVAHFALRHGATMVNSVSLAPAAELGALCAAHGASLVLTHCRGSMTDMAGFSEYDDEGYEDVVEDVKREWQQAAETARQAGLAPERLIFDPGLGFAKNARQSLELCVRLSEFCSLGHPILVGTSRKSYIASVVGAELGSPPPAPADRLGGSIVAAVECVRQGASIVRVHDVATTRQALAYRTALSGSGGYADPAAAASSRRACAGGDRA